MGMAYGMASMGMACMAWVAVYGRGLARAWGVRAGGRSPMAMAGGGGASGVPIQRNLLNVYPNLEL